MIADKQKILLGITGSVAAVKARHLATALSAHFQLKIVFTKCSLIFISSSDLNYLRQAYAVYQDEHEFSWNYGDSVLHIELRKWADVMLVAPLCANTLAKFTYGLCDNLISLVFRAWDFSKEGGILKRKVILAPAMNTMMLQNPITDKQFKQLRGIGCIILDTCQKKLACGQVGKGALLPVQQIVALTLQACQKPKQANQ